MAQPRLNVSPGGYNFGTVPVGVPVSFSFTLKDFGDTYAVGIGWTTTRTGSTDFVVTFDSGGCNVGAPGTITVQYTPSALGAATAQLTLNATSVNTPVVISLGGTGGVGGTITLFPQTTNDFGNVKDGLTSGVLNVELQNNSGTDVSVTAINFNGPFAAGGALPSLPFTQHANHADPAVIIPVVFQPTQTGFISTFNAVSVVNGGSPNPAVQQMQGTGFFITPAFIIANTARRLLLGYNNGMSPVILQADSDDLDTEEMAYLHGVYDYNTPLYEKYMNRHVLRAEDLGTFGYTLAITTRRGTASVTLSGQGGVGDGGVDNYFANVGLSDDLIEVDISRAALDGPMSITQLFHEVEQKGEYIQNT